MRLLIINGSPKGERSNTYRLTSAFAEGVCSAAESCEIKRLQVNTLDIKPCLGCFACWNKTPGTCCIRDDMASVLEDMRWADVVVWSFPLYYFSIPGPLKNLMDRQLPLSQPFMSREAESGGHPSRYDMSHQRHVVISTCGFYTAQGNYDGVHAIFDHLCGKGNYETIFCGQGELFRVKELKATTDAYLASVRKAGQEFASGKISASTHSCLMQLLFPRDVFEAMADASWGVEKDGNASDESLVFTRQMAALYNKAAWKGKDLVLQMNYTDIGKTYQILLTKEESRVITQDFLMPTTTIHTTYTLWKAIAAGEADGQSALMEGKYRVTGDFNLMIHWDSYFGSSSAATPQKTEQRKTNMMLLLLPWMAFWIATASAGLSGAIVSILVSVMLPLIFFKNRVLLYDQLSAAFVSICSLLLLADVSLNTVLPLSYLAFGLLWTVGGLQKLPLTAHYSANDYGGEGMLSNPLFIKTNRILTLCWGILYLMMTAWSFILMNMGVHWIATVNSILPGAMGIFTIWFQKWYPAHVARGK